MGVELDELPFITVVMPVRNEERFIAETLTQILNQDYPRDRFEIIVADGMSEDRTRSIVKNIQVSYPNVLLYDNPRRLSSAGRNVGFKNGQGDIFLVVDGHCFIPTDQLFRHIVTCFKKSGALCLGRPQPLDPPNISVFQKAVATARASKIGHSGNSFIYSQREGFVSPVSLGAIYKREVFDRIGYVDESFDACEDVEFNYRLEKNGMQAYMSPYLTIKYYPREDLKGLFRQMMRYGRGRVRFIRKHPETINLDMMIPPIFSLFLLLLPFFGLFYPFFFYGWMVIFGVYGTLILVFSTLLAIEEKFRLIIYLPFVFITIHFSLVLGFFDGMIRCIMDTMKNMLQRMGTIK